ncbi:MAG: class I SAM-dependent methyltransferase [Myxococcota bacterium]|nr:class I SAM-dependent methyltransferase [Myxococcota bacterium]
MHTPDEFRHLVDKHDYFAALHSGSKAEQLFHPARLRVVSGITDWVGKGVLEVGSGTGCLAIPLAEAGAEVTAAELSFEHLETLRGYAAERSLSLPVVQSDARRLPFADDSFDRVLVASLVHLVARSGSLLREAERVCRPEGRIVVAGPWQKHPKSMTWLKTLLRGGKAPDGRKYPFNLPRLKQLLLRSTYLGSNYDYPMGYFATLWVPDKKPS